MKYLLLIFAFLFTGCAVKHAPLQSVEKVDFSRYLGTWYEIARYEHSFEKGCLNVSATYALKDNGDISVLNQCTLEDGTQKKAQGVAYAVDKSNAKLKVSFFRPFYGNYWILMLDEAYTYAVIGEPSREYFWILSRTPSLEQKTLDSILSAMPSLGYTKELLIWTKQNDNAN